jgi:hypothetical protein
VVYDCTGECYDLVDTCSIDGRCIQTSDTEARCASTPDDCGAVAAAYASLAAAAGLVPAPSDTTTSAPGGFPVVCSPNEPGDCAVIPGHCSIGLGACWYLGDLRALSDQYTSLDNLAGAYQALGCSKPTSCTCPAPPAIVTCETNPDGGFWPSPLGWDVTHACVIFR